MIKLPMIFSDGAVLQRRQPVALWGGSEGNREITVTLGAASATAAVVNGAWRLELPAMEAASGLTLTVSGDGGDRVTLRDVAVGEVWLAGGQSNMEFIMNWDADRAEVLDSYTNPNFRYYECPKVSYPGQLEEEDHSDEGIWRPARPGDLAYFSAVGFYFQRKLATWIGEDVPIAVIGCTIGGSSCAAWMPDEYLDGDLDYYIKAREEAAAACTEEDFEDYKRRQAASLTPEMKERHHKMMQTPVTALRTFGPGGPGGGRPRFTEEDRARMRRTHLAPFSRFRAGGLYEFMLKPVMPYTIAGFLWYQGEEDAAKWELYERLFGNMIRCWRDGWGKELPFLFAQLPTYGNLGPQNWLDFVPIRRVQEIVARTTPGVSMVVTMDVGMCYDIHPKVKRPIGERLADQAAALVYGCELDCFSPDVNAAEKLEGAVRVRLNHARGLHMDGETMEGLVLKVNGKVREDVSARIEGDCFVISCPAVRPDSLVRVEYEQQCYCPVNVFNGRNYPVLPFIVEV